MRGKVADVDVCCLFIYLLERFATTSPLPPPPPQSLCRAIRAGSWRRSGKDLAHNTAHKYIINRIAIGVRRSAYLRYIYMLERHIIVISCKPNMSRANCRPYCVVRPRMTSAFACTPFTCFTAPRVLHARHTRLTLVSNKRLQCCTRNGGRDRFTALSESPNRLWGLCAECTY